MAAIVNYNTIDILLPEIPLADWEKTKDTLQLFTQILGKIKLALMPRKNHWWNISLHVTPRGLTTQTIPYGDRTFEIQLDFIYHQLIINVSDGQVKSFIIGNNFCVAEFYNALFGKLCELGIQVQIPNAVPYENKCITPFATDFDNKSYDIEYVTRYWKILMQVDSIFREFSGRFYGKTSPVQLFWHSFDLVVTRFSGKRASDVPDNSKVNKEAYTHELISFGFWPGDDEFQEPAFYSYTHPSPKGLDKEKLLPKEAYWTERNNSPLAIYRYEDMRREKNPRLALLDFLESTYQAGAKLAGWDVKDFEVPPL